METEMVNESTTETKVTENKAFHFLILKNNNCNIRCQKVQSWINYSANEF